MGKQGPCYHCGVTSTPLWRNGPPEKPVLCNACGSRWRTKGTLANYTPLHARAETVDYEDQRVSRVKSVPLNKNKEVKLVKRKQNYDNAAYGGLTPEYNQGFQKVVDEDTSNRSSSGSAISNSESCAQFGGTDASDLTGPSQSVVWDTMVPSKKRTCTGRPKHASVEKLTKDLCTILHEQQSYFSASSEEDLLFESETPMVSVEIGHGSILIRHPSSIAREEESEASSLSVDNKQCLMSEAYSCSGTIPMLSGCTGTGKNFSSQGVARNSADHTMQQEQHERDKSQLEKLEVLGNHDSPLCLIDLNDVVNYEEFSSNLTNEEQHQLLKYLPVVDTAKLPDSLKMMFDSFQFKENLTYFQQLLGEGVFDISLLGAKLEDCKMLKRLALSNPSKSKWVELYNFLKRCGNKAGICNDMESPAVASSNVANIKRLRDSPHQNFPELRTEMRSPKRVIIKAGCGGKGVVDGSSFVRCTFNSQEMLTDGREKRRKPDMWSPQERNEFIDVFLAQGRDFKAVLERVKSKNKEQVRQFYYRSLEKVNKLLRPFQYVIRDKSCADAILALKCYWTLERRCDRSPKNVAGFADELYRMIMEHKGASLTVGHAFSLSNSAAYTSSHQHPTLGGIHLQPQQPLAQRPTVPAYMINNVIRQPPLIPSLSTTQFASPAATPSPPRLSHLNFNNLNDFLPGPSVMLPSLHNTPALSFASALPAQSLASYALQHDAHKLHPQQLDAQLAPLKRHSAPEVHPTLPPLKRLKDAPPSPPPAHFSVPVAPVACWATATAATNVKREDDDQRRLHTAAEVLAALMPAKSVVA